MAVTGGKGLNVMTSWCCCCCWCWWREGAAEEGHHKEIDEQGFIYDTTLQWRHNEPDGVSNHQPHDCLLNRLFNHRSKETSKLRVAGLCEGNSLVTGEFPVQRASNAKKMFPFDGVIMSSDCELNVVVEELETVCLEAPMKALTHLPRTKWPPFRRRHFQTHFLDEKGWFLTKILLKFVPKGPIYNNQVLV